MSIRLHFHRHGIRRLGIAVKGTNGQLTNFKAHIPRRLLSGHYGIMDPNQVKAAIVDSEGRMSFVQGSKSVEGDEVHVGSSFERKPYKGMEMNHEGIPHFGSNSEYAIDDQEFGITDGEPMTEPVDQQTSESESKTTYQVLLLRSLISTVMGLPILILK